MVQGFTGFNDHWPFGDMAIARQPASAIVSVVAFSIPCACLAQVAPQLSAASYLVNDLRESATSVLSGTEVRKMKDRSGTTMTDKHLVDSVASEFTWVPNAYKQTFGFIHLSDKHIFSTIQSIQDDGVLSMHIGSDPRRFPAELWVEMADGFIAATGA